MDFQNIKLAIDTYFQGEAAEAYIVIGAFLLVLISSTILWFSLKDRFAFALTITVLVVSLLMAGGFAYLLVRDGANKSNLLSVVERKDKNQAIEVLQVEKDRMQVVVDGYLNLRRMFALVALIGAGLILFSHHSIAHAVAVGALLFSLSGVIIDRYSEDRAQIYLGQLNNFVKTK